MTTTNRWAVALLLMVAAAVGCGELTDVELTNLALDREAVIHGEDNRLEYYQLTDPDHQRWARESVVAVLSKVSLRIEDGTVRLLSVPMSDSPYLNVCETERFADQMAPANCSAALIDDDLVLTAGHCFDAAADCDDAVFVFNFYNSAPGVRMPITIDNLFTCKQRAVVSYNNQPTFGQQIDHAIIQLDRKVNGNLWRPAPVRTAATELAQGTPVILMGFPSGLPLKADLTGTVWDGDGNLLQDGYFESTYDHFAGNSGAPVFDEQGVIAGIHVTGVAGYPEDYVPSGDCNIAAVAPELSGFDDGPRQSYANYAIAELCTVKHWPSGRLCGTGDPYCGDGSCNGGETFADCTRDCPAPPCGDDICAAGEAAICPADCPPPPPAGWTCAATHYDRGEDCDCGCGLVDPDCSDVSLPVVGCATGWRCSLGVCQPPPPEVPATWTCVDASYAHLDGCHCNCGAYDPDCATQGSIALNCPVDWTCSAAGLCVDPRPAVPEGDPDGGCRQIPSSAWAGLAALWLVRRRQAMLSRRFVSPST